jgi:hypothetical protein
LRSERRDKPGGALKYHISVSNHEQ